MAQESNLQVAPQDAKKAAPPAADVSVHFKRNLFIEGQSSGNRINKDGHRATGENARRSELVSQPESLRRDYSEFLDSYVQSLVRIQERNASILNGREHAPEREMLNLLTRTENGVMQADSAKIRAFLEKPEGWMIATQVIEQQAAFKMFALGLYEAIKPEGVRNARPGDPNHVHLDIGRGAVNRWLHNRTDGVGSRIAAAFDNINPWNSGTVVDIRQSGAVLQSIKGSANAAQERQYILEMYGIDVNDFSVATVGDKTQIMLNSVQLSRRNANEVRDETIDALYMRREFYASLGVPESNLDALPEQYLYNYSEQVGTNNPTAIGMERTGAVWQSRIEEAFNSGGGIVDMDGTPRMIKNAGGELVPNPSFRVNQRAVALTPVAIDFPSTLRNYREARAKVMTDMIRTYIQREMARPDPDRPIATIREKITARGEGGAEVAKRQEVFTKKKQESEARKTHVAGEKARIDRLAQQRKTQQTAFDEVRRGLGGAEPTLANINTEITTQQDLINGIDPTTNTLRATSIEARRQAYDTQLIKDINTEIAGAGFDPKTNPKTRMELEEKIRARVEARYGPLYARLDTEEKAANDRIAELNKLKTKLQDAEAGFKTDEIKDAEKAVASLSSDFDWLIKAYPPSVPVLTDAQLRGLSWDQIQQRIHSINAIDSNVGWAAASDKRPENVLSVLRAQAEARARGIDATDSVMTAEQPRIKAMKDCNITESQLRTMTRAELLKLVHAAYNNNNTVGWADGNDTAANLAILEGAINGAFRRAEIRSQVLSAQTKEFDAEIDKATQDAEAVSLKDEADRLSVTADLMGRQGEVFSQVNNLMTDAARFTDTTAVNPTDSTLSTSEKATYSYTVKVPATPGHRATTRTMTVQYPRGYLELMNMMFDYRERPDRDEYFKKASAVMTPDKMRQVLVASGRLQGNTLDEVLADFRTKISGRAAAPGVAPEEPSFGPLETQQLMKRLVNQLRDEALAM